MKEERKDAEEQVVRACLYVYDEETEQWNRLRAREIESIGQRRLAALVDGTIPPLHSFSTWQWVQEEPGR